MGSSEAIRDAAEVRARIEVAVQRALDEFEPQTTRAPAPAKAMQRRHIVAYYAPRPAPPAPGGDAAPEADDEAPDTLRSPGIESAAPPASGSTARRAPSKTDR